MNDAISLVVDNLLGKKINLDIELGYGQTNNKFVKVVNDILNCSSKYRAIEHEVYIKDIYLKNHLFITKDDFYKLTGIRSAYFTITSKLFEFDSNSRETICYTDGFYNIISVVTKKVNDNKFYPVLLNPIELVVLCTIMINNDESDKVSIDFIGVDWKEVNAKELICEKASHVDLFKIPPTDLYIDFSYTPQVQVWLSGASQSWDSGIKEWARAYIRHFVESAREGVDAMDRKLIQPFLKYIN